MKGIIDVLQEEVKQAFEKAGYDGKYAKVTISNRPDLVSTSAMVRLPWQKSIIKHRFRWQSRLLNY